MAYKLLIMDLDGTLLNTNLKISATNLTAIQKLSSEKKVPVTVFTGRSFNSAFDFVKEISAEIPVVFQNGALIVEPKTKKEYNRISLPGSLAFEIATEAKKIGLDVVCYNDFYSFKDMCLERDVWVGHPFASYFENNSWRCTYSNDVLNHIIQMTEIAQLAIVGNMDSLTAFRNKMDIQYHGKISAIISSVRGNYGFLEFFGPGVSKGHAFKFLTSHYNVSASEAVFIGDSYNDIELMKLVGMPVAMGNSPKEIMSLCKLCVKDNENHGVADAIERLFFS